MNTRNVVDVQRLGRGGMFMFKNIELEFKSNNCREDDVLKLKLHFFKTKYGKRTFKYNAPRLWNALPIHIRTVGNIDVFKKMVKTMLIQDTDGFNG